MTNLSPQNGAVLPLPAAKISAAKTSALPALEVLKIMAISREGDRRESILVHQGKGYLQVPAAGHEALAALVYALDERDTIYPYYRERAIALARGVSTYQIALGFFAKAASHSAGRQMSSHYSDFDRKIVASATLTGLQCLPAAGTAWANQRAEAGAVTVCFIGEASIRQGEFYEALCFALEKRLPLIFVVEDNGYGISTPTAGTTPWDVGALSESARTRVDGRDAEAVFRAATEAVKAARSGEGPQVLWMEIDRLWSHTASDDHRVYRPAHEIETMLARDPIEITANTLIEARKLTRKQWEDELSHIVRQVDEDYQRAESAPDPDPANVKTHLFSQAECRPQKSGLPAQDNWTLVAALNATLHRALEADEKILMFGQDIADPKGGVFGVTKGLSTRFPDRVCNSPLAEATIAGAAVGLALAGYKPVFEIQFVDFIGPAFSQIVNQIATLRWRSAGAWKCPLVLLAPYGAYLPAGGPWHSQANEAWFAHTPGLQIAVPSTPQDAAALLKLAIAGDDPVLLLLPKHLFRHRFDMAEDELIGFAQAAIRNYGSDVTVVAWGNCVEIAQRAALEMADENVSVEVLDLRTLVPCDWAAIRQSLTKTGRLVVVQEDNESCSFGQAVVSRAVSAPENWELLAAPPQLVARPDVHVPFHPALEAAVLPGVEQVCDAIRLTMSF